MNRCKYTVSLWSVAVSLRSVVSCVMRLACPAVCRALLFLSVVVVLFVSCSTKKNTASSRWWHAFKARYNTYYNGSVAYIDGSLEKEEGNVDNYTELIPLYTVGNKNSRELGRGNFERAVTKAEKAIHQHSIKRRPVWDKQRRKTARDVEWLSRREYNPFLWKAWMLMGRSQFHMGDFDEAASTFSYMSRLYATQPAVYGKARAWLAKCYTEAGWLYDAEDVIRNMARDSMDWRAVKEWDYTYADYYIHTADYHRAIPYLRRVIRHEMRRKQKAREWFLLGQLYAAVGKSDSAYRAFRHVVRLNPPYNLEFNARIAQTEVLAKGRSRRMIGRLRRMAASDNNKDYLDQVYYAMGNIYLADRDTIHALSAYEKGARESVRNGVEKGVLLLRLGNLYWNREQFGDARRCYGVAIGLLDQDRDDYRQLSERSRILDELIPYTDAVTLQDSLQSLAHMSETDRNAAIDRVIDELRKKEREERRLRQEEEARLALDAAAANVETAPGRPATTPTTPGAIAGNGQWYFYNPMAVSQGKMMFRKLWGKRENVDNWQRVNKTVVAGFSTTDTASGQQDDEALPDDSGSGPGVSGPDSVVADPLKREYYMAQIPFTDEQMKESDALIQEGLFRAGVIFKDKLDNLRLAEKYFTRLTTKYTEYAGMDEAYYHLYLLYMRQHREDMAARCLAQLREKYAGSTWTAMLTDPYFMEDARTGVHMEDSLYAATYEAFKAGRMEEVIRNLSVSSRRFPMGDNRGKFLFIGALAKLNEGRTDSCLADLNAVVARYPESEIARLAGMIINGVNSGRSLHGGTFDIGDVWSRRAEATGSGGTDSIPLFSNERDTEFKFVIVYRPDSVNANQLLFELARYNFTNFMVRNFEIAVNDYQGYCQMEVSGFRNYDEALQYARQLHARHILQRYDGIRTLLISNYNLELVGNPYSFDDYARFFSKHFAPLKVSTFRLLAEPAEVVVRGSDEPTVEDVDKALDNGTWVGYPEPATDRRGGTYVLPEEELGQPQNGGVTVTPAGEVVPRETGGIVVTAPAVPETVTSSVETTPGNTVTAPATPSANTADKGVSVTVPSAPAAGKSTVPAATPSVVNTGKAAPASPQKPVPNVPRPAVSKTGIYFRDKPVTVPADTVRNKKKKPAATKKKTFDLEDEYYDLEGF